MSRRPPDRGTVVFLHNEGLTTAEICRRTGFERRFVTRWTQRLFHSMMRSEKTLRSVETKMRRKRHRSSRVIASELNKQNVAVYTYTLHINRKIFLFLYTYM